MVGGRRHLPDLPPVVRRRERRRHRRPARASPATWTTWSGWASTPSGSNPITVSPNKDWGYDVADYCDVDPALGTLADFDELVAGRGRAEHRRAHGPGARTTRATSTRGSSTPAPPATRPTGTGTCGPTGPAGDPDGALPNNWQSSFGGPAWSFDAVTGQWYLHHFVPEQPDLNWWNPDLVEEFDRILRFWFDRGVAGFRIDVCHMIIKDKELRDNPPVDFWIDHEAERMQRRAARAARRPAALARGWPRPTTRPGCSSARPTSPARPAWPASTARATSSSWPSTSRSSTRRSTPSRCAGSSTTRRPRCRPAHGRSGRGPTTTTAASRPGGRRTTRPHPARHAHAADPAGHAGPLLRRRDRHGRHAHHAQPAAGPGGLPELAGRWTGATSPGRRCSGGAGRGRASPAPTSPHGCRSATTTGATWPTSATTRTRR